MGREFMKRRAGMIVVLAAFALAAGDSARAQAVYQQGPADNRPVDHAASRGGPPPTALPPFGPLPLKHQEYLDKILAYWEQSSAAIKRYRCTFRRWEYDCVFGPSSDFSTYSEGEIKYAAPDKGLFKVNTFLQYKPPEKPGGKAQWPADDSRREQWVCDGQSVWEYNYRERQLIERPLPPEMRGAAIADGPLPFLFGAQAQKIKDRYWIRVVTPRDAKGEYRLEAFPKRQEDAANYKKVHVIIDEERFLPKGLIVFDPSYDERSNPSKTTFAFENREVNWSVIAEKLNPFHREFSRPETPKGWTKVVGDPGWAAGGQSDGVQASRR
jgi:TIGR03009 family protein